MAELTGMAEPGRRRGWAIAALTAALATAAALLALGPLSSSTPAASGIPWWTLVPLFTAAELLVVHLQARRESLTISFAEIPLVIGLVVCDGIGLLGAVLLGSALGLLHRRQSLEKIVFNLSLIALWAALSFSVYRELLAGADPTGLRGIAVAMATIVLADLMAAAATTAVVWLRVGAYDDGVLSEAVTSGLIVAVTNTAVGLLVLVLLQTKPAAAVLLLVVVATLALAYRGYSRLSRGHARLEALYRFTRRLGGEMRTSAVAEEVLRQARDALAATSCELVIVPGAGSPRLRLRLAGELVTRLPAGYPRWCHPVMAGRCALLPNAGGSGLAGLAVPLHVDDEVVGMLVVEGRAPHLEAFSDSDLRLFESLANHASVALHKAQLLDQLQEEAAASEHRSLHDALTGLPNRRSALSALEEQLAICPATGVLVLDLDGFTQINEALGYDTGNELLMEAGHRLATLTVGTGHVSRLGNDEFAVVLPGVWNEEHARSRAAAILARLAEPFVLGDLTVVVGACGGLAVAPQHGQAAGALLQRADAAMYAAKRDHVGVRMWDTEREAVSARHLELLASLREAITRRELTVVYQPKVASSTGVPIGAEALVRWEHPVHGFVAPDEFIPLAEHSGLVLPLTDVVLELALTACAGWRSGGADYTVAVNVSSRSLIEPTFPERVRSALARAGLPASSLLLEMTETAVITDLGRVEQTLHALRELGVWLSLDDYGTGQSSLSYIRSLPVQEVKIDRSFISGITENSGDAAVARATIELGHALGLQVVAEGIEDEPTRQLLADWGCDLLQGYLVSRPLKPADFAAWLRAAERAAAMPHPVGYPLAMVPESA